MKNRVVTFVLLVIFFFSLGLESSAKVIKGGKKGKEVKLPYEMALRIPSGQGVNLIVDEDKHLIRIEADKSNTKEIVVFLRYGMLLRIPSGQGVNLIVDEDKHLIRIEADKTNTKDILIFFSDGSVIYLKPGSVLDIIRTASGMLRIKLVEGEATYVKDGIIRSLTPGDEIIVPGSEGRPWWETEGQIEQPIASPVSTW